MSNQRYPHLGKPWAKRSGETSRAFRAFLAYLELGPERSYVGVARALEHPDSYKHQVGRWRDKYNWEERVGAYEAEILERSIGDRSSALQKARQILVNGAQKAATQLVAIAGGELPEKHAATQVQACLHVLELAGIVKPKRLEIIDGKTDKALKDARREASKMSGPMLDAVRAILATDSTGQAVH